MLLSQEQYSGNTYVDFSLSWAVSALVFTTVSMTIKHSYKTSTHCQESLVTFFMNKRIASRTVASKLSDQCFFIDYGAIIANLGSYACVSYYQ